MEIFFYLGETVVAKRGAADSVITNIRCGRSKFRYLVPLFASTVFP